MSPLFPPDSGLGLLALSDVFFGPNFFSLLSVSLPFFQYGMLLPLKLDTGFHPPSAFSEFSKVSASPFLSPFRLSV